ncbi:hypothetical protein AAG906_029578 [Vitis piasezkii]
MFSFLHMASFTMKIHCFQRNFSFSSSALVPVQLPSRMETHFWYILPDEVKSATLLNQYLDILSPCEKENVLRMHGDNLKKSALLARALVRTTIARYQINSQVSPTSLKFRKNIYGKPEVDWQNHYDRNPPPLHFNISHTSSLIACGVTLDSPIGIDVEEKQRTTKNNILSFARRYFSPMKWNPYLLFQTLKFSGRNFKIMDTQGEEAYVKALGRGFSAAPFKNFTIRFRAATEGHLHLSGNSNSKASEIIVESSDDPKTLTSNWQFALLELTGSHYAAICKEKDDDTVEGKGSVPMKLTVRKTIPFVEDQCISGKDALVLVGGL